MTKTLCKISQIKKFLIADGFLKKTKNPVPKFKSQMVDDESCVKKRNSMIIFFVISNKRKILK